MEGVQCFIKRDDLSGCDVSGNKVRKLEFLLADAVANGDYDSVVTIGGAQSNHARATAVAARQLGLDPHLILRGPKGEADSLTGNLLFDQLVGAKIYPVTAAEYGEAGQEKLCGELAERLRKEGRRPYVVPVGGSNAVGVWGYMNFVRELMEQVAASGTVIHHVIFACGSGGTAAGLALGFQLLRHHLSDKGEDTSTVVPKIHAVGVCDSPDVFYAHIEEMAQTVGAPMEALGDVRSWIKLYQGQGLGYAQSRPGELQYLAKLARSTGVLLDPVYSGKAAYYAFADTATADADSEGGGITIPMGESCMFLHTGGVFGTYDKVSELVSSGAVDPSSQVVAGWRS